MSYKPDFADSSFTFSIIHHSTQETGQQKSSAKALLFVVRISQL